MKNFSIASKPLVVVGLAAALIGCSANPVNFAFTRALNMGIDLPDDMVNRHVAGVVAFDEQWAGNYERLARNSLYTQGVRDGTLELNYRVVRINLHQTGHALWVKQGQLLWTTGAFVPDHLPQLRAGDTVEVRQTGTWMTMEDFATRGEGNIVVRILCVKADPEYQKCVDQGPRTGEFRGVGATNTPYPASVLDYGFAFTPMFDAKGNALRPYPQATTTAAR